MIHAIKRLLGIKNYLVEITWENGEKEIVPIKAWSPMNAIKKVEQTIDVVNEVYITILDDHTKFGRIRYCKARKRQSRRIACLVQNKSQGNLICNIRSGRKS